VLAAAIQKVGVWIWSSPAAAIDGDMGVTGAQTPTCWLADARLVASLNLKTASCEREILRRRTPDR